MQDKQVKDWITLNGQHIPIYENESKDDAVNRSIAKMNEEKKQSDIVNAQKERNRLNNDDAIINSFNASNDAVTFMKQAIERIKKDRATGTGRVIIGQTTAKSGEKAENPKNTALEKELSKLADDNDVYVTFETVTKNRTEKKETRVIHIYDVNKTQTKTRYMIASMK